MEVSESAVRKIFCDGLWILLCCQHGASPCDDGFPTQSLTYTFQKIDYRRDVRIQKCPASDDTEEAESVAMRAHPPLSLPRRRLGDLAQRC